LSQKKKKLTTFIFWRPVGRILHLTGIDCDSPASLPLVDHHIRT
jgi:hypothetical protein